MKVSHVAFLLPALGAWAAPLEPRQDRPKELINPDLFPVLVRYARFSVASLATFIFGGGQCPSPPYSSKLVGKVENKITDTQAAIFQDDGEREFILSFVGSSSIQDFVTDFAFIQRPFPGCADCALHGGVYTSFQSVEKDAIAQLSNLTAQHPGYMITVTGHSLGGGLAAVAWPSLKADASNLPIRNVYTYGELRVGNQAFANYVDRLCVASDSNIGEYYRVTHNTDGVPNLPRMDMNFRHSRTEIFQLDDASNKTTAQTTYRCFGQEALDCNLGVANGFINQDHLVYSGVQMTNGEQCGISGGIGK